MVQRRILLVDAHRHSRRLYRIVLEHAGWNVRELSNGLEAIDSVHRERPAVIVMELALPFLDGRRTAEELKKDPSIAGIPVLLLTAERQAGERSGLLHGWWDGFLRKPCDPGALLLEVERLAGSTGAPPPSRGHLAPRPERRSLAVPAVARGGIGKHAPGRFASSPG